MDELRLPNVKRRRRLCRLAGIAAGTLVLTCLIPVATRTLARPSAAAMRAQGTGPAALARIADGASASIDLGSIAAGGQAEKHVRFTNALDDMLEIVRVETSCPCLSVDFADLCIAPRQTVEAVVRLDLSDEPEFVGGLSPEFRCLDSFGNERFVGSVEAMITAKSHEQSHSRQPVALSTEVLP